MRNIQKLFDTCHLSRSSSGSWCIYMLCFRKTRSVWITICEDFEECQSSSVFYDGNDNLCEYFCILVQFLLFMQNVLILLLSYYFFINKIYFWNSIKVIEQIINVDFWIFFSSSLLFVECFFYTFFLLVQQVFQQCVSFFSSQLIEIFAHFLVCCRERSTEDRLLMIFHANYHKSSQSCFII